MATYFEYECVDCAQPQGLVPVTAQKFSERVGTAHEEPQVHNKWEVSYLPGDYFKLVHCRCRDCK